MNRIKFTPAKQVYDAIYKEERDKRPIVMIKFIYKSFDNINTFGQIAIPLLENYKFKALLKMKDIESRPGFQFWIDSEEGKKFVGNLRLFPDHTKSLPPPSSLNH